MEETCTLTLIEETGYKNWKDFYFHQNSYKDQQGVFQYYYSKPNDERSQIELPFPKQILRVLALEESKQLLTHIREKSFTELLESKKNLSMEFFIFHVVIIEEDKSITYKKISITMDDMISLSELEKMAFPYVVYDNAKQNRPLNAGSL